MHSAEADGDTIHINHMHMHEACVTGNSLVIGMMI